MASVTQVVGLVALALAAPDLAAGRWYGPTQLGAAHLLGLGFLTLSIVGALLQLVPVLIRRTLGRTSVMAAAGGALAVGGWSTALGLWTATPAAIGIGGSLSVCALLVLAGVLVVALVTSRNDAPSRDVRTGLGLATAWLVSLIVVGGMLAADRTSSFLHVDRVRLLSAHTTIAAGGWVAGTILAIALRLAPMFALSHGHHRHLGRLAMAAWHLGVLVLAIGLGVQQQQTVQAGAATLALGGCLTAGFAIDVTRHRRRRIEAPLVHLVVGSVAATAAPASALGAQAAGHTLRGVVVAAILVIVGLGCGVTSGHMFKVIPMLVWTGRYAGRAGTQGAPRLADMYPARIASAELILFTAGLIVLVAGLASASGSLARLGALLLASAAVCVVAATAISVFGNAGTHEPTTSPRHRPLEGPT
ncbi:MAG: hypothetical protein U0Y82_14955 [Thermoleophilia bacterium]